MIEEDVKMKNCPFGCSHHIFPNHYKFCPYCGTKLDISELDNAVFNSRFKNRHRNLKNFPRL
jgi:NADH pyrophosphatase NudC (nudix superfamily)